VLVQAKVEPVNWHTGNRSGYGKIWTTVRIRILRTARRPIRIQDSAKPYNNNYYYWIINAAFKESVEQSKVEARLNALLNTLEHLFQSFYLLINCFDSNLHPQFLTTTATLQYHVFLRTRRGGIFTSYCF
jgi:hypothetical protein